MTLKLKWRLLFIIILFLCFCDGVVEDVKSLRLHIKLKERTSKCDSDPFHIEVGGQFRVYVHREYEQRTQAQIFYQSRCRYPLVSENYAPIKFSTDNGTNILVSDPLHMPATYNHTLDFECVFYTRYSNCNHFKGGTCQVTNNPDDKGIACKTKVYIQDSGKAVFPQLGYLSVNSEKFTASFEVQKYKFYDGEGTKFICHKTAGSVGSEVVLTHMKYTNGKVLTLRRLERPDNATMYMKLSADNDGETMECAIHNLNYPEQRIGLKLVVRKDTRGMLTVVVNGLILPRTKESEDHYYYQYMYIIDESLTVAVIKDDAMYGDETCTVGYKIVEKTQTHVESQMKRNYYDLFTINKEESTYFCCELWKIDSRQYTQHRVTRHIIVEFLLQTAYYSPYIINLSMSNVLLQYSNSTSNIIQYVIGNEPLYLSCSIEDYNNWIYSDTEVKTKNHDDYIRSFQLRPGRTNANIQCKDIYKTTYLELVRGRDVETTTVDTAISRTTTLATTTSRSTTEPTSADHSTEIPKGGVWGIVLTVMLLVLLVALGLWKLFNNKKQRLQENNSSNMDYQNLPEHHEGPMNTPSQWNRPDDVVYAEPNLIDNLYAKPIPKSERNNTEPTYAEPEHSTYPNNYQINNATADASVQNNKPTYANQNAINYQNLSTSEVENTYAWDNIKTSNGIKSKKSDRPYGKEPLSHNPNLEGQNSSDMAYAEIYLKNPEVNFEPTNVPVYSTVERSYVNLMAEFRDKNPGYVNGDVKNSVEPAYCEIIKPKK